MKWSKAIIVILAISWISTSAQTDLYNPDNSLKYARYLSATAQYREAANEYERILFMLPQSDSVRNELFTIYRKGGLFTQAQKKYDKLYSSSPASYTVKKEYLRVKILNNTFTETDISNDTLFNEAEKAEFKASYLLLQYKQAEAANLIAGNRSLSPLLKSYEELSKTKIKQKSPGLAMLMSAVVPGSGKVYSSFWKDGIMSFIFVTSSFYQSYRGFSKTGIKSGIGWAFGGVALGFYGGNIYGSYKSAQKYNGKQKKLFRQKVENLYKLSF